MFVRMIVLMCISFYLSRYLLAELGVTDFGILSVVGSVLATFMSIKTLFSESVQRFINYEKGKGQPENVRIIFSMSVYIHLILAILFLLIVEVVGLYLLYNKLDIPEERFDTALVVFHLSVLASSIGIMCIPYDALIIANERLDFFAILSIADGLLKLIGVIIIAHLPFDMLKWYGGVLLLMPLLNLLAEVIYSRRFPESSFIRVWDRQIFRKIFSLTSWNFFGNISFSLIHEGINVLLNMFGGVAYNASRSIAYQVRSLVTQMSNNIMVPVRPHVMQQAAQVPATKLSEYIIKISRISYLVIYCIVIPIIAMCPELLALWLKEVPANTVTLTRLTLLASLLRTLHEPLNMFYMAEGKIRRMMIIESTIMLATLFVIYLCFYVGLQFEIAFVIMSVMEVAIVLLLSYNGKRELDFNFSKYLSQVVTPLLSLSAAVLVILFFARDMIEVNNILSILLAFAFWFLLTMASSMLIINKEEKKIIIETIRKYGKNFC